MSTFFQNSRPQIGFLVAALIAGLNSLASATTVELVGRAYDLNSGKPIYTEHHQQQFKGANLTSHTVEYKDPDGKVIATKQLNYDTQQSTPTFELKELRRGLIEGAKIENGNYTLFYRKNSEAKLETGEIPRTDNTVVDAGFDRFVSNNFDKLLAGETQKVEFGVPGRQEAYAFKLTDIKQIQLFGRPALSLRIKPSSFVLRLLVDPLELVYDIKTKRLMRYQGRSNIPSPNGDRYDARIDFSPNENRAAFGE